MKASIGDLTVTKIAHLLEKKLDSRQLRREVKLLLEERDNNKKNSLDNYIKRLEDEVQNYRTLKNLLK